MTITVLWWRAPALLTVLWLVFALWLSQQRGAWAEIASTILLVLTALPVLCIWLIAMGWRLAWIAA